MPVIRTASSCFEWTTLLLELFFSFFLSVLVLYIPLSGKISLDHAVRFTARCWGFWCRGGFVGGNPRVFSGFDVAWLSSWTNAASRDTCRNIRTLQKSLPGYPNPFFRVRQVTGTTCSKRNEMNNFFFFLHLVRHFCLKTDHLL